MIDGKKQGKGVIRSKRDLFFILKNSNSPKGPGDYNINSISPSNQLLKTKKVPFLSSLSRFGINYFPNALVPGPGQYIQTMSNILLKAQNSHSFAFGSKIDPNKTEIDNYPGPATYDVLSSLKNRKCIDLNKNIKGKRSSLPKTFDLFNIKEDAYSIKVGPGTYNPNEKYIKTKCKMMANLKYNDDEKKIKQNLNILISELKYMNKRPLSPKQIVKNRDKPIINSPFFLSQTNKSPKEFEGRNKEPGPCEYNTNVEGTYIPYLNSSFAKSEKFKYFTNINNAILLKSKPDYIPGVGTYHIESSSINRPKLINRNDPLKSTSPFKSGICREIFNINEENPGPGSYNNRRTILKDDVFEGRNYSFGSFAPRFNEKMSEPEIIQEKIPDNKHGDSESENVNNNSQYVRNTPHQMNSKRYQQDLIKLNQRKEKIEKILNSRIEDNDKKPLKRKQSSIENIRETVDKKEKVKSFIQNIVNSISGIAFNSHTERFKHNKKILNKCPGPGEYTTIMNKLPILIKYPKYTERFKNDYLLDGRKIDKNLKAAAGCYNCESSWLKNSYNISFPDNILDKRKENLLNMRIVNYITKENID